MHIVCPHCLSTNRVPPDRQQEGPTCGRCGQTLLKGEPVALNDTALARVIERTEVPVLIDFWAAWCGPCRQMAPQFATAAHQLQGQVQFVKIDSDACPQASSRFAVRSIPTLVLLKQGQEVARLSGAMPAAQIVQWVRQHLG